MGRPRITFDNQRVALNEEEGGLGCRACGCRHFFVVYTRPRDNGTIIRRRECRHCGKRITTHERESGAR